MKVMSLLLNYLPIFREISSSAERSASEFPAICIIGMFVSGFVRTGLSSGTSILPKVATNALPGSCVVVPLFKLSSSSCKIKKLKSLHKLYYFRNLPISSSSNCPIFLFKANCVCLSISLIFSIVKPCHSSCHAHACL